MCVCVYVSVRPFVRPGPGVCPGLLPPSRLFGWLLNKKAARVEVNISLHDLPILDRDDSPPLTFRR